MELDKIKLANEAFSKIKRVNAGQFWSCGRGTLNRRSIFLGLRIRNETRGLSLDWIPYVVFDVLFSDFENNSIITHPLP